MKKLSFLFVCLATVLVATAQTINDPNATVRVAKDFHGISVSSAFDVYLTQGNEEAVAVSAADTKDRDRIIVEVKDGILIIGLEKGSWKWRGNKKLKAYISFKKIDKLDVSGACDVYLTGTIESDKLSIVLSGASDLKKAKIDVKTLSIDLSGASDIVITGKATQASIEASGASNFKGVDLVTDICTAKASGASDISITVNRELNANATGASDIKYRGDGVIKDIHTSGASGIRKI